MDKKTKSDKTDPKIVIDLKELEAEYRANYPLALRLSDELKRQLDEIVVQMEISLAFPIENRVKTWTSLTRKLDEKALDIKNIRQLDDLVGLRIILLFLRDISKTYKLIEDNFRVIEKEDTQKRLRDNEFGYQSIHYIIELPESWFAIPTFSLLKGFRAELQVRTAAQHIWAAASHKLQYKNESGVPEPVRRSINRVSALLEIVDFEFERVLENRAEYIEHVNLTKVTGLLNVDLLKTILDKMLPDKNQTKDDNYAEILEDLLVFKIDTPIKLTSLLDKHLDAVLQIDLKRVNELRNDTKQKLASKERLINGVFFTHVGLTRNALAQEFGDKWNKYISQKSVERKKIKKEMKLIK